MLQVPLFTELESARRVLVAGAGGGFDVFSGLPLYFGLRDAGREVFLANLTFSYLPPSAGPLLTRALARVTADSEGNERYFPEKYLCEWFRQRGDEVSIYCFYRTGPAPIAEAYRWLCDHLSIDTVVLVDGGTDSLMRGDECGLGTPQEDIASIAAVHALDVPRKVLTCVGFGIDAYHGVCHAHVLAAVADLIASGGYLGAISLVQEMSEVQRYREAADFVMARMPGHPSIVCSSILSALEGRFGDVHRTTRTAGSELFINPLMSLCWGFRLDHVARRILYLDDVRDIDDWSEMTQAIHRFQARLPETRPWSPIPH